jgi:streptomycin 6-kinase
MDAPVLLHADLHHWNILSSQRGCWLAIDPKGVVGEPAYETGAWLRNPFPQLLHSSHALGMTQRRLDQMAEGLGFDRLRLACWAFAQAVLSAWWAFEDHSYDWRQSLAVAEMLQQLT